MSENQPIFPTKSLSFGPIARPDSRPPSVFTQLGQRRQLKHFFLALAGLNRIGRLRMPRAYPSSRLAIPLRSTQVRSRPSTIRITTAWQWQQRPTMPAPW